MPQYGCFLIFLQIYLATVLAMGLPRNHSVSTKIQRLSECKVQQGVADLKDRQREIVSRAALLPRRQLSLLLWLLPSRPLRPVRPHNLKILPRATS